MVTAAETKTMTRSVTRSSVVRSSPLKETWSGKYITRSMLETSAISLSPSPTKSKKNVAFQGQGVKPVASSSGSSPRRRKPGQREMSSMSSDEGVGDVSLHSHLLPDIPAILIRPRHPLKQAWTLWYYRNERSVSWEANQQEVATITTIEEFWQLHQLLQPASRLGLGTDYGMFRAGILPDWEDPANSQGGRWIVRMDRSLVDAAWLELLFYLIGEHADTQAGQVNGVVVSVRKKGGKVAVWLAEARNMVAVVDIGRQVRARLGIGGEARIKFSVHKEEKERSEGLGSGERLPDILL